MLNLVPCSARSCGPEWAGLFGAQGQGHAAAAGPLGGTQCLTQCLQTVWKCWGHCCSQEAPRGPWPCPRRGQKTPPLLRRCGAAWRGQSARPTGRVREARAE